jgi:ArsR family transcriptional regulator, arsenate/arsenite/antimonite-responsive transcriptional repressor
LRNDEQLAMQFKALGDPTRLRLFRSLLDCCGAIAIENNGDIRPVSTQNSLTVGEVCCRVTGEERITSTLSAHLKELRLAGLITMEKSGRHVICAVNRESVAVLVQFLHDTNHYTNLGEKKDECC